MWFHAYEWKDNPFSIKPNVNLVGLEKEKELLHHHVTSGTICLLTGDTGTGKTSLLRLVRSELGKERVVYLNAEELDEFFDLHKHLRRERPFIEKLLFRKPRDFILLLDEGHASDAQLKNHIKTLYDNGVLKGVVMAQTKPPFDYSDSFKHRIGNRIVRMKKLTDDHARELIELRTDAKHPFSQEAISTLTRRAQHNPRKLLEVCELVALHLSPRVKSGELSQIGPDHAEAVLDEMEDNFFEEEPYRLVQPALDPGVLDMEGVDEQLSFSPMQKRITKVLIEGNRTAKQLAEILATSEGSIGKQLSLLTERRVVKVVNHRRPKLYGVSDDFRGDLAAL